MEWVILWIRRSLGFLELIVLVKYFWLRHNLNFSINRSPLINFQRGKTRFMFSFVNTNIDHVSLISSQFTIKEIVQEYE